MELEDLTIEGARAAIASKQITATDLAELHYARIDAQDGTINSFLSLSRERALRQAAKIDEMAAKGEELASAGWGACRNQGRAGDAGRTGYSWVADFEGVSASLRCYCCDEAGGCGSGSAGKT